jgi:hypothetical protein
MDPKGSPMEDVIRGLSLLGPTLNDLAAQVNDIEKRLVALTAVVATKADKEAVETLKKITPTSEDFRHLDNKVENNKQNLEDVFTKVEKNSRSLHDLSTLTDNQKTELVDFQSQVSKELVNMKEACATKADKGTMPLLDDFDNKGILLKVNRIEVPTFEQVPALVQTEFDAVGSKLKAHEISISANIDELKALISGRAEKSAVPTREDMEDLSKELSKACTDAEEKLMTKVADICRRLDHKADLKWTQDSIRSLSDILLPVARAVRGLPAAATSGASPLSKSPLDG